MSTTAVLTLPSPALAVRMNASPPKATGQRLLVPPQEQHWKQQYSKQRVMHLTYSPLTKSYHRKSCKVCYPDLPDSFHTRPRGHQIELAVVWFKTFFFFFFLSPSLEEVVLYTANAHLLEDAGEATSLQGFKQRQDRSTEENPTEVSQAAKTTSSPGSPRTKRAEGLGKGKWHLNYDCLFYCPQVSTYSHRSEPVWPIFYFLFLLASLPLDRDRKELLGLIPASSSDNAFCPGKWREEVTFSPFPRLLIQSQNVKSAHQTMYYLIYLDPQDGVTWETESSHRTKRQALWAANPLQQTADSEKPCTGSQLLFVLSWF